MPGLIQKLRMTLIMIISARKYFVMLVMECGVYGRDRLSSRQVSSASAWQQAADQSQAFHFDVLCMPGRSWAFPRVLLVLLRNSQRSESIQVNRYKFAEKPVNRVIRCLLRDSFGEERK